jgi:hypothetical protein
MNSASAYWWRLQMTADKTELQSAVYVALMKDNSDPSRFPMPPAHLLINDRLLSRISRKSGNEGSPLHFWQGEMP